MDAVKTRAREAFARYLLASILLAALLVFAGCGGGSERSSLAEESTEAGSTAEEASETTEETTDETSGETASSTRPYTAIVGSGESGSGASDEALVDGAEDLSDGLLKENRLVAYYGNPREGAMGVLGETDPETMM